MQCKFKVSYNNAAYILAQVSCRKHMKNAVHVGSIQGFGTEWHEISMALILKKVKLICFKLSNGQRQERRIDSGLGFCLCGKFLHTCVHMKT